LALEFVVSVLHLRGRRGDSDGLISFNLMPVETSLSEDPAPVPGRVSDTRVMLVHYWRRDQQAFAEAEAAALLETDAPIPVSDYSTDYSTGNVFVNGEPVRPPQGNEPALPPPAPAYDPNRPDFLTSLKSRVREQRTTATGGPATGPLFVDDPAAPALAGAADASKADRPSVNLFGDSGEQPAATAATKATSIWDTPMSDAERLFQENLAILSGPRPTPAEEEPAAEAVAAPMQASTPAEAAEVPKGGQGRQAKIQALESFLKRVASRRQQIESESVA
jgi:hypothetical protein